MTLKKLLLFTLTLCLWSLTSLLLPHTAVAQTTSDWYMAGANPGRTSWVNSPVDGTLTVQWSRPIESYIDQKTQIVSVDNRLYIATANGLIVLNATNGSLLWRWDTQLPLGHTPTVFNNTVYIGGFDHKLHALNATTGNHLWSFNGAKAGYITSPLVVPNPQNHSVVYLGNRDGKLYAIGGQGHPQQGQQIWAYQTQGQINYSAAFHNGIIYFASDDNFAYALNSTNGSLAWPQPVKLTSDGFHSWWPVIYKDKVIFSQTNPYREDRTSPNITDSSKQIDRVWQVWGDPNAPENQNKYLSDTVIPARPWSGGYGVYSASRLTEAYERMPNSTSQNKHLYWMRPYVALFLSSGQEYEFDSDNDGYPEGLPFSYWAKPGQTIHPPLISPDNILFAGAAFQCCSDAKGKVYGWTDTEPHYLSLVGTSISNNNPSATGGWAAMAEPQIISGAGNRIFRSLCCDRVGDSFSTVSPSATRTYWAYNLGSQLPKYDEGYFVSHTAISRHINWYHGFQDFFPQQQKIWEVLVSSTPRAQYSFNPRRNDVFSETQTSQTVNLTATWPDGFTETLSVTIPKPTVCDPDNPTTINVPDPHPNDAYTITMTGIARCYAPNSINGQYGSHADQNPLVPHQGRLFTHRSNVIIAYGTGTSLGQLHRLAKNKPTSSTSTTSQDVRSRLETEVNKIISAGGFLRPAYTTAQLHNYGDLADYFTNPGDTLYALSLAYPHLSSNQKAQVASYLQNYLNEYFGTGSDSTMYARTGWAGLQSRDSGQIPPDILFRIPQRSKTTSSEGGSTWSYPPQNIYYLYVYASTVPGVNPLTIYDKVKTKLPATLNLDLLRPTLTNDAFQHNAWITGYQGFLKLQELAGRQSDTQYSRTQYTNTLNQLLNLRQELFTKNSPYALQGNIYRKTMDLARNFLYLNPELATFYRSSNSALNAQVMLALEEYEAIAPFWFVAKYEAVPTESGTQSLYQIPALFQAKAMIQQLPQQELIKYLDAPSMTRGDLF